MNHETLQQHYEETCLPSETPEPRFAEPGPGVRNGKPTGHDCEVELTDYGTVVSNILKLTKDEILRRIKSDAGGVSGTHKRLSKNRLAVILATSLFVFDRHGEILQGPPCSDLL